MHICMWAHRHKISVVTSETLLFFFNDFGTQYLASHRWTDNTHLLYLLSEIQLHKHWDNLYIPRHIYEQIYRLEYPYESREEFP